MRNSSIDFGSKVKLFVILGFSLLYASTYYLPLLTPTGAYLLPSSDLVRLILMPTVIFTVIATPVAYTATEVARRLLNPPALTALCAVVLSVLTLIGLKGVFYAGGSDWRDNVPWGSNLFAKLHYTKAIAGLLVMTLVWLTRPYLDKWSRWLSSLGYAFFLLATWRLVTLFLNGHETSPVLPKTAGEDARPSASVPTVASVAQSSGSRPRRVVWVIFDELDFLSLFGQDSIHSPFENFDRLAGVSVFARQANSPASATIYSIPSLLTGVPLSSEGIKIDRSASVLIERPGQEPIRLQENTSIFGAVAANGGHSSVLGFYHPYCKLFRLARCDSMAWPSAGGLAAALWSNFPDYISNKVNSDGGWDGISRKSLKLLPEYLSRDEALTFIHLNFPHPPADFADSLLRLPRSTDPLVEYSRNLMLADQVLGSIVSELERDRSRHETLLIVSTDHWLRNLWYHADVTESEKPIPFFAWKVGDREGRILSQPVSTVNTRFMILDYLKGNITTQTDIAQWWGGKPVIPSYIAK